MAIEKLPTGTEGAQPVRKPADVLPHPSIEPRKHRPRKAVLAAAAVTTAVGAGFIAKDQLGGNSTAKSTVPETTATVNPGSAISEPLTTSPAETTIVVPSTVVTPSTTPATEAPTTLTPSTTEVKPAVDPALQQEQIKIIEDNIDKALNLTPEEIAAWEKNNPEYGANSIRYAFPVLNVTGAKASSSYIQTGSDGNASSMHHPIKDVNGKESVTESKPSFGFIQTFVDENGNIVDAEVVGPLVGVITVPLSATEWAMVPLIYVNQPQVPESFILPGAAFRYNLNNPADVGFNQAAINYMHKIGVLNPDPFTWINMSRVEIIQRNEPVSADKIPNNEDLYKKLASAYGQPVDSIVSNDVAELSMLMFKKDTKGMEELIKNLEANNQILTKNNEAAFLANLKKGFSNPQDALNYFQFRRISFFNNVDAAFK